MSRLATLLLPVLLLGACKQTDPPNEETTSPLPTAVPLEGTWEGKTFEDWAAAWWQWTYALPYTDHPLFDDTGEHCDLGQTGPVFFLGGTFEAGPVHRLCAMFEGPSLFFPVVNYVYDNGGVPEADQLSDDEMTTILTETMDTVTDAVATLDGRALEVGRLGPVEFGYTLPADDSLYEYWGMPDWNGATVEPSFTEGYWVMIDDLAPGIYDLAFSATIPYDPEMANDDFVIDVTYEIHISM